MLISRTLARKRIAAGHRPSFKAAWLPVAVDTILIALVAVLLWNPALTLVYVMQFNIITTIMFLFVVIYAPVQIVIIVSTIWAVRSRWDDTGKD